MNGLWQPIPPRGTLFKSRHREVGLGPSTNDMTDFKDSHGMPHHPCEAERGWDRGQWGTEEEGRERELGLTCKTS